MEPDNLFAPAAPPSAGEPEERIAVLAAVAGCRVERIVSFGTASPPGFWYDQPAAEWVVVLAGYAELAFADAPEPCRLGPGDHVLIPAHRRHRVALTAADQPTIWLAVHFPEDAPQSSATTRAEGGDA